MSNVSKIQIHDDLFDIQDAGARELISDETTARTTAIGNITEKIPDQASADNKLADKSFVNSSIATNTAYFRGTFMSVEALEEYAGEKTNNDYAFVTSVNAQGQVTAYNRYKWVDGSTHWTYEYTLNNSSFTSEQWAAINSGVTEQFLSNIGTKVTSISELSTNDQYPSAKCVYDLIGNVEELLERLL